MQAIFDIEQKVNEASMGYNPSIENVLQRGFNLILNLLIILVIVLALAGINLLGILAFGIGVFDDIIGIP